MTPRTHTLRPGAQWLRRPTAPLSLRPLTLLLVLAGVALIAAAVLAIAFAADAWLSTWRHPPRAATAPALVQGAGDEIAIDELAWLAGTWREEREGGELLEERWQPPLGNCMTGTLRWLREGEAFLYEFLLLEATDDGLRLYVRHFDVGCVAWEEKDAPLVMDLAEQGPDEVAFTAERDFPSRYTIRRESGGVLLVRLEGLRDGAPSRLEFRYRRVED